MKVLLFHPTLLPPKDYGGVERVVIWLTRGLLSLGHEVHVAALPGSQLPSGAKLLEIDPKVQSDDQVLRLLPKGLDLIHFMAPPGKKMLSGIEAHSLVTVHGNGKPGEKFPKNTNFLTADHAKRHGAQVFVYNGIDPEECIFDPKGKKDFHLFLSKTSWGVKNVRGAIRYAAKAGANLRVAGGLRPWSARLKVALTPGMSWEGSVSGEKKARLLSEARALVFPVLWPEPFGLVVVEALMSGTPVLASPHGSLPELVPSDVGALLPIGEADEEAWIEILKRKTLPWSPERCREFAMSRFHYSQMAAGYEALYKRILSGETLHAVEPVAGDWRK